MTAEDRKSGLGKRLSEDGQLTADEIDSMEVGELVSYLSAKGIDVASMNASIPSLKEKFESHLRFHRKDYVPFFQHNEPCRSIEFLNKEQIVNALVEQYGSLENVPLAARNFKEFSIHEWRSLYKDLILGGD